VERVSGEGGGEITFRCVETSVPPLSINIAVQYSVAPSFSIMPAER